MCFTLAVLLGNHLFHEWFDASAEGGKPRPVYRVSPGAGGLEREADSRETLVLDCLKCIQGVNQIEGLRVPI